MSKKMIRCNTQLATTNISTKTMHVGKVNNKDMHQEYYVIENVSHMIRGAVMNGLLYGNKVFDELADNLMVSNARVPAPLSHPSDEKGNFVSANDPITYPSHNIGAFDTDWRVNGDKLISNTYIPVDAISNGKQDNEWFAERINNKEPIDRSTGLYLNVDDSSGYGVDGEPYAGNVTEIYELNHSAILNPDIEPGAKNNGEGVGMFTNSAGDKIEINETDLHINASTPAMQLPLAPDTHNFNEAQALLNIRAYTNSNDKPSSNYRKFFLNFDQDNVDSFDSYTNLFADVINGVPHAVKSTMSNSDSEHAKTYMNRFNECIKENKQGFVKSAINKLFALIGGEHAMVNDSDFVYRGENDKLYMQQYNNSDGQLAFVGEPIEVIKVADEYKPIINNNGDRIMRDKILAALTAANVKTDGLDDDALFAAFNELNAQSGEDKSTANNLTIEDVQTAVANAVKPLQEQINANSDKELTKARADVVALDKGIDEEMAANLNLVSCTKFLASHGHVAVNAATQHNHSKADAYSATVMPE